MLEILNTTIGNIPVAIIAAIVAGLLRALAGWVENALKDGVVDNVEWKQLAGTVVQYFSYIMLLLIGIEPASEVLGNSISQETAVPLATTFAFVLESIRTSLKKINKPS